MFQVVYFLTIILMAESGLLFQFPSGSIGGFSLYPTDAGLARVNIFASSDLQVHALLHHYQQVLLFVSIHRSLDLSRPSIPALLLLSGDVSPNPGPVKFPSGVCS